jgi:hypothetical protein
MIPDVMIEEWPSRCLVLRRWRVRRAGNLE